MLQVLKRLSAITTRLLLYTDYLDIDDLYECSSVTKLSMDIIITTRCLYTLETLYISYLMVIVILIVVWNLPLIINYYILSILLLIHR